MSDEEEDSLESGSMEEIYLLDYLIGIICDMQKEGKITDTEANNMLDSMTGEKSDEETDNGS